MSEADFGVRIMPMRMEDVERVAALAGEIWRAHYPGIIAQAQIDYMLAQRYNPEVMRAELARDGIWWDLACVGNDPIAFASYFLTDVAGEMKLDKIYVQQRYQRAGLGGLLIEHACRTARGRGCWRLVLAVNRHNVNAIGAYRKHGFAIEGSVVKDIGGGFVMDDYLMVRTL